MNSSQVGSVIPSSGFLTRTMLPVTLPWHKMTGSPSSALGRAYLRGIFSKTEAQAVDCICMKETKRSGNNWHGAFLNFLYLMMH